MTPASTSFLQGLSDNIVIDPKKCTFCGICVDTCILDNLRLKLAPCRRDCPLHTNCQGYVQLIARGDDPKALKTVAEVLPFPGIVGRICSHQCESNCTRLEVDGQAVAIRDLKRYLADNVPLPPIEVAPDRTQSVAVVGAGPAGAMAAFGLRTLGFQVHIYEANSSLGGLLATAIPEFRLPRSVLDQEMALLPSLGVNIHLNTRIGRDVSLSQLLQQHDAVLIATGAQRPKQLGIPGEDLHGVIEGLSFLQEAKASAPPQLGRRVAVIGGGNTAVDAAQTALRLGSKSVTIVCLESRDQMPAFSWEVEDACEEGVEVICGWGPLRILSSCSSLKLVLRRCLTVVDASGRFSPSFDECQVSELEADSIVIAIGQEVDSSFASELGLPSTRVQVDPLTLQCLSPEGSPLSEGKLFAAGDVASGPRTMVEALAAGREAAESIRRLHDGEDLHYGRAYPGPYESDFEVDKTTAVKRRRVEPSKLAVHDRRTFAELTATMTEEQARAEAERCLSCGEPFGKFRTCWFCLPCEVECPEDALWVEIPYLLR